jgi:WD40 repeat protein
VLLKFKRTPRHQRRGDDRWTVELPDFAQALSWAPDGEALAVATLAGPVFVLDGETGKELARDAGHRGGAMAIAFSPDGTRLVSGGQDGCVLSWTRDGRRLGSQFGGGTWVDHVVWSPEGDCVATAAGRIVRLWTPALDLVAEVSGYESTVSSLFWLPGTSQMVTSCYGGLQFVEVGEAEWARHLDWNGAIVAAAPSGDGAYIAAGNQDASVHVWNTRTGRDLAMTGYRTKVRELAWSPDGQLLATGGGEEITLWSFAGRGPAGRAPEVLRGHEGRVTGLGFLPDGRRLVSCGDDGGLLIWERAGRKFQLTKVRETERSLHSLSLSPDGARVAVAADGGEVTVWPL